MPFGLTRREVTGPVDQRPRAQLYESFGAYVRSQRQLAQLTLRQAAELASISNPYLSQIEHGLALPSVTVLSALADALQVSADTLLLRAAGVSGGGTHQSPGTEEAIRHDSRLDDAQKHALLAVLSTFVRPSARLAPRSAAVESSTAAVSKAPRRRRPPKAPDTKREAQDHV
jgi:transcriptional regulator with XRE-family HTH domain